MKLYELIQQQLEDMKAHDVLALDVKEITSIADTMFIASTTSSRHTKSVAQSIVRSAKLQGFELLGIEGQEAGEWILVDLGDVIVHLMQPKIRDFYHIEKLWSMPTPQVAQIN